MTIRLAALACACLALSACDDIFTPPYSYGEVVVVAATPEGTPAPDIRFLLYNGTRHLAFETTGPDGKAHFRFVPEGALGLSGAGMGAYSVEEPYIGFRMTEGERRTVTFTGIGPGAMRVRVEDPDGTPIPGLHVQVYHGNRTVAEKVVEGPEPLLFADLRVEEYGVRVIERETCRLPPSGFAYSDGHQVEEGAVVDVAFVIDC